jgi:prepilin-type N-terminal cleavage/methylation domain-containing protein
MKRHRTQSGFTLWELILVMVVITIALAMAAPSLGGWGRSAKLRDIGDQFLAVTRFARSQAIADATVYRLNIDTSANTYWLTMQQGQQFIELGNSFGQLHTLPEGYRIILHATAGPADQPAATTIDFLPNGRLTPAQIQIVNDLGATLDIAALAATEQFHVVEAGEVQP